MIRVRDLKVWFPLRRGLLREIVGRASLWVRAVDGVSFDIRRGEVYCLVGESGCGKTTTGKSLLSLVNPTEGDVFLEMPDEEYEAYTIARRQPQNPDAKSRTDELRRKYSLTWKENLPWRTNDRLIYAGIVALASLAAWFLPALLGLVVSDPFDSAGIAIGLSIGIGIALGGISSLPLARASRRTPTIVALLGILAFNVVPILSAWISSTWGNGSSPFNLYDAWAGPWGTNTFGMLFGEVFAPVSAAGVARAVYAVRQEREGLAGIKMRTLRRRLHLIFQDPYESLNPKQSVLEIVEEPLRVNRISSDPSEISSLVRQALEDAGLRPAEEFMLRFPHELSGGQRQRVSIAAALVLRPDFIVADEPVSMLDVSIRTEILQLMMELRRTRGLTYLFITHDLGLAWIIADRVAVMYLGKIVESGTPEQVIAHPKHPYTQALVSVIPSPDPRHVVKRTILKGERPDAVEIPPGCRFHPRCPLAFERCGWSTEEVASALRDFQRVIADQVGEQIRDRLARAKEIRARAAQPGEAAAMLTSQAYAIEADLPNLQAALARAQALQEPMTGTGPRGMEVRPPPGMTTSDLREQLEALVAAKRDERLAFRAISTVRVEGDSVVLELHESTEPQLFEIAPGNTVACHLVTAPVPGAEPIPAA